MILPNPTLQEQIKEHVLKNVQEESCGLVVLDSDGYKAIPCENVHRNKQDFFTVSPIDYIRVSKKHHILGCYHSQLDYDKFTYTDLHYAAHHGIIYILYCIEKDTFLEFNPKENTFELQKFIGRSFIRNRYNCFELVKDYFLDKYKFRFKDYFFDKDWFEKQLYNFADIFEKEYSKDFRLVTDLELDDIICFCSPQNPNPHHLGIYLSKNEFLHHPEQRVSRIQEYNKFFRDNTKFILRYNGK